MFKGSIRKCKISVMLKITLLYGYNCSYAVPQRVQCKEYNLQFMLLCNSCIYFAHAIKIVWYIVISSSHNTGAPNEHFSENEPLTTENENLDAFKAFSSAFLCCWKEFICSSLPAG